MYITAFNATAHETGSDDGLETVGGKGRSLARMARAGFNVPGGFIVTVAAYRSFVAANQLQRKIVSLASPPWRMAGSPSRKRPKPYRHCSPSTICPPKSPQGSAKPTALSTTRPSPCARPPMPRTCRSCPSPASRRPISTSRAGRGRRGGTQLLGVPLDAASHQLSASERHRPGLGGHGGGRPDHGAFPSIGNPLHRQPGHRGALGDHRQRQLRSWAKPWSAGR